MIAKLIEWYGTLDKDTVALLGRFVAKTMSMKNRNEYIKRVLTKELDKEIETNGEAKDS